jgi:hypothetical protein
MTSLTPGGAAAQPLPAYLPPRRPADDGSSFPPYLPALILLAAATGAIVRDTRRRRGLRPRLVYVESGARRRR